MKNDNRDALIMPFITYAAPNALILICLFIMSGCTSNDESNDNNAVSQKAALQLSPLVERVIHTKIIEIKKLTTQPDILSEIVRAKKANDKLSADEISQIDKKWRTVDADDPMFQRYMLNNCAKALREFQNLHRGYPEIFVTDHRGLNICQTNKTSDFYQADEDWWIKTYAKGHGYTYYGTIEYDDSSFSESIPIYFPIQAAESQKVIGVMKVVLDLSVIEEAL